MENIQQKYSAIITNFLKSRPILSAKGLEQELGLPDSTIRQALAGVRPIPEKHIYPVLCKLAEYGLAIDGYQLTYDPSDDTLSGRRWIENVDTIEKDGGFEYIVKEYRILFSDYFDLI